MLDVDVFKRLGAVTIAARFESPDGVLALFGPSGAGKTSLVNMIAGLMKPDRGRITLDGDVLDDSETYRHLPAYRRHIGYMFQDSRLFPHMSVAQNLDYGRRMNHLPHDAVHERRITDMLDIGELRDRRPGRLSGGERQRVALGRALLSKPRLLLLDEPLGSLDDERKAEILPYLTRLRDQRNVPMVYVSHSPAEIRQLATRVVILRAGKVVAEGGVDILMPGVSAAF